MWPLRYKTDHEVVLLIRNDHGVSLARGRQCCLRPRCFVTNWISVADVNSKQHKQTQNITPTNTQTCTAGKLWGSERHKYGFLVFVVDQVLQSRRRNYASAMPSCHCVQVALAAGAPGRSCCGPCRSRSRANPTHDMGCPASHHLRGPALSTEEGGPGKQVQSRRTVWPTARAHARKRRARGAVIDLAHQATAPTPPPRLHASPTAPLPTQRCTPLPTHP